MLYTVKKISTTMINRLLVIDRRELFFLMVRQPGGDPSGPGGGDDLQNTYNLTLEYNPDGGHVRLDRFDGEGHISAPPADHQVSEGSNVNVKIEPAQGYIIQEVRIDGEPLIDETGKPVTEYTFENISADHTLHVTFIQPEYEITVTYSENGWVEDGEGEAVDSSTVYTVRHGEDIRFRFFPENGYKASFSVDDQPAETRDEYEFRNVTANHTLDVEFIKKATVRCIK